MYDRCFFICFTRSPQCTDKDSNKKLIAIFLPCVLMYQKCEISSSGIQNREIETKNRRLGMIVMLFEDLKFWGKQISPTFSYFLINNALMYHFLANLLAHNKKMTDKSVFHEVSCFWSRGFVPHRKWNFTFLVCQNMGEENHYWIFFLLYLSVHCGDFIK